MLLLNLFHKELLSPEPWSADRRSYCLTKRPAVCCVLSLVSSNDLQVSCLTSFSSSCPLTSIANSCVSALDSESEHLVQKAIDDMIARGKGDQGRGPMTVIIVAHRLSTVRSADCIFVVKEGQVVEQGSHNYLISNPDGAYSLLIRRQMEAQAGLENGNGVASHEESAAAL